MSVVKSWVKRISIPLITAIAVVSLAVSPAFAGGPIVYRQAGNHWTPGLFGANHNAVETWLAPGERFDMICWVDNYNSGFTGNYFSYRYFWGYAYNHGYEWVHSSYVYYQWSVRHC